jgi:hypothetical protein
MKNYSTEQRQAFLLELKQMISNYLQMCDGESHPYVCKLIETPEGYEAIEEFCVRMFILHQTSIGDAINIKERTLNPNYIKD